MEYRQLGRSDLKVSVVSLGCWIHGKAQWHDVKDEESIAAIRTALDCGVNFLDTAEWYGGGHSEQVVGQALAGVPRHKVIVATKVAPTHLKRDDVFAACERSLKHLNTDYIDLYQIHWPNENTPIEETMGALLELQQQGKIRVIGVSNFDDRQMAECLEYGRIESLQPPYSLFWRHVEAKTLPFCRQHDIGVIAYSPMAQGLLTGKFRRDTEFPEDDIRRSNVLFRGETYQTALEALEAIKPIAQARGKTLGQTAVNWVLRQPGITAAIVGGRNPQQVQENVGAADWSLTDEEVAALSKLGDKVMATLDDSPVMWR